MTLDGGCGSVDGTALVSDKGPSAVAAQEAGDHAPLSSYSRFAQRLRRRYAAELALLPPGPPNRSCVAAAYDAVRGAGHDIGTALRIVRQLVLERLIVLDCDEGAPLALVSGAMTELAEFALDVACREVQRDLDTVHGAPLGTQGQRAELWVIGMGK